MTEAVRIQVCALCGEDAAAPGAPAPGRTLCDRLAAAAGPGIRVEPVACMAVCDRPVTLVFRRAGGWSYMIGGVDPGADTAEVLAAAAAIAATPHGIPPMEARPAFFRRGVIGRLPPGPATR